MRKWQYDNAEMDIVWLDEADIITTSGPGGEGSTDTGETEINLNDLGI